MKPYDFQLYPLNAPGCVIFENIANNSRVSDYFFDVQVQND